MTIDELRFLVVEDHEFQRGALLRMLTGLGAKYVFGAADGYAALEIFRNASAPIDIVISDLNMPGMDGMEFIRNLCEGGAAPSVVLVSAMDRVLLASVEAMTTAYGINLLGAMQKPVGADKLKAMVERHMAQRDQRADRQIAAPTFTIEEIAAGLKNDEFEPFFQPKVELATGRVKGAEALARWRHPQKGIVAPYGFLKTVEDNGLVDALTWSMLQKAAACCGAWRAAGLDITIAVNLSLTSFSDVALARRLTDLVVSQNLEPRHIVLEVTESAATTDVGIALENLSRLRMKGFGLSIDDYGTGYSSMQQLMRVAFTELKIDQSFVKNASQHEASRIILESSLDMARKLKICAVAEGVETQEDWDLLYRLGCDVAQGYFIARPMEAGLFQDWAERWNGVGGSS